MLVSEGSSTSAREAITILGLAGHHVEVCDPVALVPRAVSRASSDKFHRCPGLRTDPAGFLRFVERTAGGAAFRRAAADPRTGISVCARRGAAEGRASDWRCRAFASYRTVHSKAGFSRLLDQLGLPQPPTRIVTSDDELRDAIRFPSCRQDRRSGPHSRGIWFVRDENDLEASQLYAA